MLDSWYSRALMQNFKETEKKGIKLSTDAYDKVKDKIADGDLSKCTKDERKALQIEFFMNSFGISKEKAEALANNINNIGKKTNE